MWEIGDGICKKFALVITPEQNLELMPIVKYMLRKAPILKNWEFHHYRLPSNPNDIANHTDDANDGLIIQNGQYSLSEGKYGTIDIEIFVEEDTSEDHLRNIVINLKLLLGDERFEKWVGGINVNKTSTHFDSIINNKNLLNDFDEKIKALQKKLPDYYSRDEDTDEHTAFELSPSVAKDYKARSDMALHITRAPEITDATFTEQIPFYSERFTKNGEPCFYLKIDAERTDPSFMLAVKNKLEDDLDELLLKNDLGCVIGGGIGIQYIYIDLLVKNTESAISKIQKFLKCIDLTKRIWFLFHDADLQKIWIGVHKDTPPLL